MSDIEWTLASAMYEEADMVMMTYQGLRAMYPDLMRKCELLIVNNKPGGRPSERIKGLFESWFQGTCAAARYIELGDQIGTSPSRELIMRQARGRYTLVFDPHVIFFRETLPAYMDYFANNPDSKDIVSGPLLWDSFAWGATHFNDLWQEEMWGVWGVAWETSDGGKFSVINDHESCRFVELKMKPATLNGTNFFGVDLPESLPWPQHEMKLQELGAKLIFEPGRAFEIPGQGLGMYAMRTDAWPGFNPHARNFGGEELYIHEKVRAAGGRAICLTDAKYWHKFRDEGDRIPYPNTYYAKARNYTLELTEIGQTDLIEEVRKQFVETGKLPKRIWKWLLDDPVNRESIPTDEQLGPITDVEDVYDSVRPKKRDLNEHMPTLRRLAEKCGHVTEISHRRESLIALLAAKDTKVKSYNTEINDLHAKLAIQLSGERVNAVNMTTAEIDRIEPTDMLFIDSKHDFETLEDELKRHANQVSRYIVLHDTELHAFHGEEQGKPGLVPAIRDFIERSKGQWFIAEHFRNQYGLTVLSRNPEDAPKSPLQPWPLMEGPGTELKKINSSLGINPKDECSCNRIAAEMDIAGVSGCRARREHFVEEVRKNAVNFGWIDKAKAALAAAKTGLALEITDWTDPYPSLVDIAIRRAAEIESKKRRQREAEANA